MAFTSYSSKDDVKNLAVNVQSKIADSAWGTFQRIVDGQIDSKLAGVFSNWRDIRKEVIPVPEQIRSLANMMTAAWVEKTKFAVNEAGNNVPNPYGVDLDKQAKQMLVDIANGDDMIDGLVRNSPVEGVVAEGTFEPVTGLKNTGGSWQPFGGRN